MRNLKTLEARIPNSIKSLPKDFLLAGLVSFIIDEGSVGDVITIYSKNKALLEDIREIAIKCGYKCYKIKEKYAYGKFDCYRFNISSESYETLYNDIINLSQNLPTCGLAHKMKRLKRQIHFKNSKIVSVSSVD